MDIFPWWYIFFLVFAVCATNIFALQSLALPVLGVGALVCAACAPVAGLLYQRAPHSPGDTRRWLTGTTAFALFLVPWLALMLESYGRTPSIEAVRKGYRILYWTWAAVVLLYLPGFVGVRVASWSPAVPLYTVVLSLALCVGLSTLACMSRYRARQAIDTEAASGVTDLNRKEYRQPFVWFWCSVVLALAVWWATFPSYCGQIESVVVPPLAEAIAYGCELAWW